eukprot:TRINITY_DN67486_c2_g3_i1.p2 TRINITY_DN67486_c2_g3~~TRINITY_DN67486_c2_g3_i1.p2  ORF type:complete len:340 (-),score=38.80 TRINITY_DN67486_c2_g3_i1:1370-2389(-)
MKLWIDKNTNNPENRMDPEDLNLLSFHFAFESAGTALFAKRLGLLGDNPNPYGKVWAELVRPNTQALVEMMLAENGAWRDHVTDTPESKKSLQMMGTLIETGEALLKEAQATLPEDIPSVLHDCIESLEDGKLENWDDVNVAMLFVMGAAVDTTANTILWNLHHLANNPDVQEKAREEIQRVFPGEINFKDTAKLDYLRCVLNETFRLTPTVFFGLREIQQDVQLAGYDVPAGSYVQMNQSASSMDGGLFADPTSYNPERWAKMVKEQTTEANVRINNFGRGPRMCVGVRLARAELLLGLSTMLKHYQVVPTDDYQQPTPFFFLVNAPHPTPSVRFIPI